MQESYKVRPSQSPWPRVMRAFGQPAYRSVHGTFKHQTRHRGVERIVVGLREGCDSRVVFGAKGDILLY